MHAGDKLDLLTTDDEALIDHLAKLRDEELKKTDTK
jgi:demethoxyubiquinone hydroxylase (CLK1/Coq7/Cat5 family)